MANLTTAANSLSPVIDPEIVRGIYTNDTFRSIFETITSEGGDSFDWNLMTSGVTGVVATESDAFTAEDSSAYSRPVLAYRLYQATAGESDHLKAAKKNNQAAYWDSMEVDVQEAIEGVNDAIMTQWLGSAGEGILLAVDATGTYAGLAHNTTTGWDSLEDTTSAALSYAMLDDQHEGLRDNERRMAKGTRRAYIAPENQITNLTRLSGPGVRDSFMHVTPSGQVPNPDIGQDVENARFRGAPWIGIPDMNDNTIINLPIDRCKIINHEREPGDGGWQFEEVPRGGFHTLINVSWFGLFVVKDPFRCAKLSAVTA